jgi:hypothetical protein
MLAKQVCFPSNCLDKAYEQVGGRGDAVSANPIELTGEVEDVRRIGARMVADGKRLQSKRLTINELMRIARSYGLRLSFEVIAPEDVK